jgi:hypothetical protein
LSHWYSEFSSSRNIIPFCSWNAGRLIREKGNKLHDENFIEQIKECDIVLLSETHVGYETTVDVENCFYYPLWTFLSDESSRIPRAETYKRRFIPGLHAIK